KELLRSGELPGEEGRVPALRASLDPPDPRGTQGPGRGPERPPEEDRGGPGAAGADREDGGPGPRRPAVLRRVRGGGRSGPALQSQRPLPVPPRAGALGAPRPRRLPGGLPGADGNRI